MKKLKFLFAIFVTICVSVTGMVSLNGATALAEETAIYDNVFAETYQAETELINPPTVIGKANSISEIENIVSSEKRPSNLILKMGEDGNIVDDEMRTIGTFKSVYQKLNHKIIAVVYISSQKAADALCSFFAKEINILDIAVMSDKPELVKSVKTAYPAVRGIVDYTQYSEIEVPYTLIKNANMNYATVIVLSQEASTQKNVEYMQARFKTVWTVTDSSNSVDLMDSIHSGAYGIIVDDCNTAYKIIESYPSCYARPSFNVAHRGVPNECNENSISGVKGAIEYGATHVELDGRVTSDGVIMMSHDANISRISDGEGILENMTYDELRQYNLDMFMLEPIPTLGEIMTELKGTNVVLVFELKTETLGILSVLRDTIEEYDFWDQIVVITFNEKQLEAMKTELPEIPTALLAKGVTEANFQSDYLKKIMEYNSILDCNAVGENFNESLLKDRGLIGWYWTFGSVYSVEAAAMSGYTGITNNSPDYYSVEPKRVARADIHTIREGQTFAVGDAISLNLEMYTGEVTEVEGRIYALEDDGEYFSVIASYSASENAYPMYTKKIKIHKNIEPTKKSGCSGTISGGCSVLVSLSVCALFVIKNKISNKRRIKNTFSRENNE